MPRLLLFCGLAFVELKFRLRPFVMLFGVAAQ